MKLDPGGTRTFKRSEEEWLDASTDRCVPAAGRRRDRSGGTVSQEYTSPEGKFRDLFPGRPNLSEQTVSTPIGPIVLKIASSSDWSRTERFVSYADYPVGLIHTGNRDSMLDDACQGMATEASGW